MLGFTSNWKSIVFSKSVTIRLILINVLVFLLFRIPYVFLSLAGNPTLTDSYLNWCQLNLMVPSSFIALLHRPWTLFTHLFFHQDIGHIASNMIWLYWFGEIFQQVTGTKKTFPVYLYGGIVGALLFIISYQFLPYFSAQSANSLAYGASAGVMAIIVATATLRPQYEVNLILIGRVKLIWMAMVIGIFDFISIPMDNAGGHIAHLGGAFMGWLFSYYWQRGTDFSKPINSLITALSNSFQKKPVYKKGAYRPMNDRYDKNIEPTTAFLKREQQKKTDAILDKISKSGYESLNKEEKDFLFKITNTK
jgi:membrane associated rhomboid family serine protease